MKILIVVPAIGTVYGGPSKSVIELAQALGKSGIDVDLVTTNANGDNTISVSLGQWILNKSYRVKYFKYAKIFGNKISFSLAIWLFKNIKKYDIVQTNAIFSATNLPAYLACYRYRVPNIIIPRGMLDPWALSHKAWKKSLYFYFFEKPALQNACAIQMLAPQEAGKIQNLKLKTPIIISPNGINFEKLVNLPDSEIFYKQYPHLRFKELILFLGRIDPKKGLDLLAQAFSSIKPNFPKAHVVIAGPDNIGFFTTAQKYFQDLQCQNDVTFTGMLTGDLKYAALAAADYYVAPSYSEGFSMSVLEGMACGLPCVITEGCNFPDAAEANAAHVVEINPEAIAKALYDCLQNPQEAKQMGERARNFISENYVWDKISLDLIKYYKAILVQHKSLVT